MFPSPKHCRDLHHVFASGPSARIPLGIVDHASGSYRTRSNASKIHPYPPCAADTKPSRWDEVLDGPNSSHGSCAATQTFGAALHNNFTTGVQRHRTDGPACRGHASKRVGGTTGYGSDSHIFHWIAAFLWREGEACPAYEGVRARASAKDQGLTRWRGRWRVGVRARRHCPAAWPTGPALVRVTTARPSPWLFLPAGGGLGLFWGGTTFPSRGDTAHASPLLLASPHFWI